jgi:beta-phosphoglucomutase
MVPDAIVFDFDGVIADSEPAHAHAIGAALGALGLAFPGAHDYGRFIGRGDRECLIQAASEQGHDLSPEETERLIALKGEAFLEALASGLIRPYDATIALLRGAAERGPVGVCSGSMRQSVEPILESFGVRGLVGAVVTASDVPRNKPDPASYLMVASRLGVDPGRCVAVEDSPTGIRAARAAGYAVHAVCHSFPAERLSEADHVHASSRAITLEVLESPAPAQRRP